MFEKLQQKNIFKKILIASIMFLLFFSLNVSWAAEKRQMRSGLEFGLLTDKTSFSMSEEVELDFEFKKQRYGIKRIGAWFKGLVADEYKDTGIRSRLVDQEGEVEIEYNKKGEFKVKLSDTSKLRPGKYELEIIIQDESLTNGKEIIFTQDFTWGVLAYNSNKSIYKPGEDAYLQFAVLDDNGDTLCNADLEVIIDEPGWGKKVLSTKDGSIIRNPECGPNNVIDKPDYFANYQADDIGEYKLTITALIDNGKRQINDKFEVRKNALFEIERVGPTRIYPVADYSMKILVKANEDWQGDLIESVPNEFEVKTADSRQQTAEIKEENGYKKIIWKNVQMKAGETIELNYEFDAPDVSPEFYLLGPLELVNNSKFKIRNSKFSEARQWQIAADALNVFEATGGYGFGWTNPERAWDRSNDNYAIRDIPRKSADDSANYLYATSSDAIAQNGVITLVEIGVEGIVEDITDNSVFVAPVFNGFSTGTPKEISGTRLGGADDNSTDYENITGDLAGPGANSWTWEDVENLDIMVYGYNMDTGQDRQIYIDQIRIQVTYNEPPTGTGLSVVPKTDGSGAVDIEITADDPEDDDSRIKVEYAAGTDCSSLSLSTINSSVSADYGTAPDVDNNYPYQIGTTSAWVLTNAGANTVYFDWLSKSDAPTADGTYCVQVTVNDNLQDQLVVATTTITLDNVAPQITNVVVLDQMYAIGDTMTATITVVSDTDTYTLATTSFNYATSASINLIKINNTTYTIDHTITTGDTDRSTGTIPFWVQLRDSYGNANTEYIGNLTNGSIDANAPSISSVITQDLMYAIGDTLTATITVTADTDIFQLEPSSINKATSSTGNFTKINNTTYTLTYNIQSGHTDRATGTIPYWLALMDNYGNINTPFTGSLSNGSMDANEPVIQAVYITNGIYKIGSDIDIIIDTTESGLRLGITTINGQATHSFIDNTDTTYGTVYTISEGDADQTSGNIPISVIMRDAHGNNSAAKNLAETNNASVDANKPNITAIEIPDLIYKVGDTLTATITVISDINEYSLGTSSINQATGSTGNLIKINNTTYTLDYTINEGDTDRPAGTIPVSIMLKDQVLQYNDPASTTVSVNTASIDANSPVIKAVSFIPSLGVLKVGDKATSTLTATNSEAGLFVVTATINGKDASSTFNDIGGGDYELVYTVAENDTDHPDNDDLPVYYVLRDAAGNESAAYATADPDNRPGVDGHKPIISDVYFNITSGVLKINDIATATIVSDGTGYNTGTITINGVDVSSTLAASSTNNYTVTYTVEEGHTDILDANDLPISISLIDNAGNESVAYETADPDNRPGVDGHKPIISDVYFNITSGWLKVGDTATATIVSGGTLYSAGTITINNVDVSSSLAAATGNNYTVAYIVSEGDMDVNDSADLPINISLLDTAGNQSDAYITPDAAGRPGVDGHTPTVPGNLSFIGHNNDSIIIQFGAVSSDTYFEEYKIFYKEGSSGVTENDLVHASNTDQNLGEEDFDGYSTTTISGLDLGTDYVFNIWVYDIAGNATSAAVELTAGTNYAPGNPAALTQLKSDGSTSVSNGQWTNEDSIRLQASVNDTETDSTITFYFEIATSTDAFNNSTTSPCAFDAGWDVCGSKVWATSSAAGDYSVSPFIAYASSSALYDSVVGYKWQVMACDEYNACSAWVDAGSDPNFKVDNTVPGTPSNLSEESKTSTEITLDLGTGVIEANFQEYIIYYKQGASGVTESDLQHSSSSDENLADRLFDGESTTTVENLSAGIQYVFNIWAYDEAGNKAQATEVSITTNSANNKPTGIINSATQKIDGTGRVDISIEADDQDNDDTLRALIEYEAGSSCTFSPGAKATIDTNNISVDNLPAPNVDNNASYQVGTTSAWILTSPGSNTVNFDWKSAVDEGAADNTYCLRLTVNDGTYNQSVLATTTLTLDNVNPTAPGQLTTYSTSTYSAIINFGAGSIDTNFDHYEMYYKVGTGGVTVNNIEHIDSNLDTQNYGGAGDTTISGLSAGVTYTVNIWAFDDYGNRATSTEITFTTNQIPNNPATLKQTRTDGATLITNSDWTNESSVHLSASVNDDDAGETITVYFEIASTTDAFTNSTSSACAAGASWSSCSSRVWQVVSSLGDYSATPFIATITPLNIPNEYTGLKWQVIACDSENVCSEWVDAGADPNIKIDTKSPSEPGQLSLNSYDYNSITLDFDSASIEDNFLEYIIYYKLGTSGVSESNMPHSSSTDINLDSQNYGGAGNNTIISGLVEGQDYVFNIYAYDEAGNTAGAIAEYTHSTNNRPTGSFVTTSTKLDGGGGVDISFIVDDADDDDCQARLEYSTSTDCSSFYALDPAIDELDVNATSTYGDPTVENDNEYQVGNASDWITTGSGVNTVYIDWLSELDEVNATGTYCLRLTVNDTRDDQAIFATTTVYIDNEEPSQPGDLALLSRTINSVILQFGTTSADSNFDRYKIFYQDGAIVDEDDIEHNDANLLEQNFDGAATTSINGLDPDTQYTFNIYAYDDYGNAVAAIPLTEKTNALPTGQFNSAAQKINGSGVVDISIEVYDVNGDLAQAKLEYEAGSTCEFLSSDPLYLDSNPANISADHGTPEIDNGSEYQVGSSSRIITSSGSNTINFDWLSKQDVPAANGEYCLRLTVFDGADIQTTLATTTLVVDNTVPDAPGDLTVESVTGLTVTLIFGANGADDYFNEYKIFYKQDTVGVTENDNEFNKNNDVSLGDENYLTNGSTTVSGLIQDTDYVFNIWIYDDYGNVASATNEISTTTASIQSATWREDEDTPVPASSTPPSEFENIRIRIAIANSGDWAASNTKYNLEYGVKNGTCAAAASWTTVLTNATTEHFEMTESIYFDDRASTTEQLINAEEYTFVAGYLLEDPSNQTGLISLSSNRYTEVEYNIAGTANVSNSATYCFRITADGEALDEYSEYAELMMAPPPDGDFNSATLRTDGSGIVDISIEVSDSTGDPSKAKLEYATGTSCVFSPSGDPTLDTTDANITADFGDPAIDNTNAYQVGTTSGYIITEFGSNTVNFDWLSLSDLFGADGEYCLQLTVNDSYNDQAIPATTTLYIDAANPSTPGDLSLESKTINSVTLVFGATSSDSNFKEYRIYYRQAASGVTESDELHSSSTDENLGFSNFKGATTTTISDLIQNQQYVFKIWAYDQYGNKAASIGEITTRLVPTISGVVYQADGITPDTNGYNVNFVVNGSVEESVNASVVDGSFIFQDIDPPATGTPILIYINDAGERGVMYNRFGGAGEINDFHVYINRVVVRHDDDGPLAVANINTYDKDQDAYIPVRVTGISIALDNGFDFYIWPGDTFEAGSGDVNLFNVEIDGIFTAVGEQNITVNGNWDAGSGNFEAASSTVEFTSTTTGNFIRTNGSPFYNLTLNGSNGEWTFVGRASSTATTTITAGTLIHGGDNNFETDSLFIASSSSFIKATGTGSLIFEDDGVGYFEDLNQTPNNLGNVQIGYSPAVTKLNSDFVADSLTINAGDAFDTRGHEVDITDFITVYGTYNCTDDKEGDGTITTLGTNWTVASGGIFTADTSTTTFDGTSTSTINTGGTDADHDFNILTFAKSSTATATLSSYDIRVGSDIIIGSNSILDVSASNYEIYLGGSWENSGIFVARAATTTFEANTTGHTINPGSSNFYNIEFNNSSGGWSIINNATTSNKWLITAAQSLTVNSGVFIEAQGEFKNLVGGANTTWTGSTLYLNSGINNIVNTKTGDSDLYATLRIGPNTDIKMWDSSSTVYHINSSGSLYSMDHSDTSGSLYIWGDYHVDNNNSEYWSYATDFDGDDISGAPRQCKVYLADNASTTIDHGSLNIVGISTASTTIANQGSGNYGVNIASGTVSAGYYEFRNLNSQGLIISGPTIVSSLSNGDYEIGINNGVALSIENSVIDENPELSIANCCFATSSGITASANVKLTGTPGSAWLFTEHYGNFAGEQYDSDPGDPRGFLIWDDSPAYTPESQDWRWFHDQDSLTPVSGAAATNSAPLTIGANNDLKLRITINETNGLSGENVKMRLQFSTSFDFSENVFYVGEIGSGTAWTYADGAGDDNSIIAARIHDDATANATHNESGISYSTYDHSANTPTEWEFTIHNNNAATNTVYYFRPFAAYHEIYGTSSKAVIYNGPEGYASLMVTDASLSLTVNGVVSNTVIDNITTDFTTTPDQIAFGDLAVGSEAEGAHNFTITTNAELGYQLFIYQRQDLISDVGTTIDSISTTNANPGAWAISPNPSGFGYHTCDDTLSNIGLGPSRFSAPNTYAQFNVLPEEISYSSIPVANENIDFVYKVQADNLQEAGDYQTEMVYVIVPTY